MKTFIVILIVACTTGTFATDPVSAAQNVSNLTANELTVAKNDYGVQVNGNTASKIAGIDTSKGLTANVTKYSVLINGNSIDKQGNVRLSNGGTIGSGRYYGTYVDGETVNKVGDAMLNNNGTIDHTKNKEIWNVNYELANTVGTVVNATNTGDVTAANTTSANGTMYNKVGSILTVVNGAGTGRSLVDLSKIGGH